MLPNILRHIDSGSSKVLYYQFYYLKYDVSNLDSLVIINLGTFSQANVEETTLKILDISGINSLISSTQSSNETKSMFIYNNMK